MKSLVAVLIVLAMLASGCSPKAETDLKARFNSVSARSARVAVYAQTARDALPVIAAELKKDQAWIDRAAGVLDKIKAGASQVSVSLGQIADAAITADQKILIAPLLKIVSDGLSELDQAGFFNLPGDSRLENYIHLAVIGLKAAIGLLQVAAADRLPAPGRFSAPVSSLELAWGRAVQASVLPRSAV